MTFVEICQAVHLIIRTGEGAPGLEPTTVVGQEGVLSEIVQWVNAGHSDICRLHNEWGFMQDVGELPLPADGRVITKSAIAVVLPELHRPTALMRGPDSAFILIAPDDALDNQSEVYYVPYSVWRGMYDRKPYQVGMPTRYTITNGGAIEFNATADRDYTVTLHYRKKVVPLVDDADEPMFDEDYHKCLVSWVIVNYYCGTRDDTVEMNTKHSAILRRELTRMRNEQLPDFLL